MNVVATTCGVNRCALMALLNSTPITAAGRKPIATLSAKRRAFESEPRPAAVSRTRCQYTRITAKIAPLWIAMSNTLAASPVKFSSEPARMRCPVDEIGRNSVRPSTMPMTAALTHSNVSKRSSPG